MEELLLTSLPGYAPIGGAVCLDLVNTVDWRASPVPVDLLVDGTAVAAWADRVLAVPIPEPSPGQVTELKALREAVAELMRGARDEMHLACLNGALTRDHRCLTVDGGAVIWRGEGFEAVVASVVASAAEVLTDPERLSRVRICAAEGCGWMFLDDSRGGNRRWCSMRTCGNRAKARSHYRRARIVKTR